jgi:hypothetical protein
MDKNGTPKKETTVGKWVRMREGRRSVYVIDAKAKRGSKEFVERLYYIDKRSFDVLQAEVPFAKNPTAVKRFEMEARFRVLEQGHLVLEWSRVRTMWDWLSRTSAWKQRKHIRTTRFWIRKRNDRG